MPPQDNVPAGTRPPTSNRIKELQVGARTADALVYIVGIAGVAGGALLLRADLTGYAVIAWALTFCAGAALRLLATMARAMAELLMRARDAGERLRYGPEGPGAEPTDDPADRWQHLH